MSYLVLARKWRPQNFAEVVGQPHVTKTLQNAIRSQRIAHAYLFTGARGVGKTSVARILAKNLNCQNPTVAPPCNECSNCREITQGSSVDVLEIDGASNRGIDSIRELRETVRYRPAKSPYKIYIIDEVHMLTTEAFNALLKTLEEPPDHVLFIFATTEPHKIPATILSRCQRFDFRRIATPEIVTHLRRIADQEQVALSDAVLYAVAREADGSMRDGQSLLEQLLAFSADGLSDEEVLDVLGVVDRRSVHRVARAVLEADVRACLEVVADIYRRGIDSRRFCQQLCDHFRNLLFWRLTENDPALQPDLPAEEVQVLQQEAGRVSGESLYLYFQMIVKGEETIRRSTLPRIALEMLLLRLTQLPRLESLDGLLEKLSGLEAQLSGSPGLGAPAQDSVPPPAAPIPRNPVHVPPEPDPPAGGEPSAAPKPAPSHDHEPGGPQQTAPPPPAPLRAPEDVEKTWPDFLSWLQNQDQVLAAKLSHSRVSKTSETELMLEVAEIYENAVNGKDSLQQLSDQARNFWGKNFQWSIRGRSSFQGRGSGTSAKAAAPKTNTKRLVLENPVVQQALEILGGELIDIRTLKRIRRRAAGDDSADQS